jgi:hypothetical protein
MSITRTVGVITTFGGISLIGLFALNKLKPQLSKSQLEKLKKQLEEKSIPILPVAEKTPLEQWQIKYAKLTALEKAQLNKSVIANLGFSVSNTGTIEYSQNEIGQRTRAEQEYPISKKETDTFQVNDCKALDVTLRDITLKIAEEGQKLLGKSPNKIYLEALQKRKIVLQNLFTTKSCSVKIENERQDETGLILTKQAIEVEESLKSNLTVDQNIYLGTGSLLLLTGMFFLLKK